MVGRASGSLRARRVVATLMVALGSWVAFGTLVSPVGPYPLPTPLWIAAGIAALGTAWSGVRLLQEHAEAAKFATLLLCLWLAMSVAQAAIIGLLVFVNPFTVAQTVFLLIALTVLWQPRWR